jgi:hypothetical protein
METSSRLKLSRPLTTGQSNRIKRITARGSSSRGARKELDFLNKVYSISPYYYLLCAMTFSQNKLDSTKAAVLENLVKRIAEGRDDATMINGAVQAHAARLGIHKAKRPPQESSQGVKNSAFLVFTNAELGGTREVFGKCMGDMIKKVAVDSAWKAAVTMDFPRWPTPENPVPCVMSLKVCEADVKELVMALFKVELNWVAGVLHIVHVGGMTQVIPHSEMTLKGVSDEVTMARFGPEIHAAITESPIRARELAEGKRLTECISMIVTGREGTIKLAMGIRGSVQICSKLYT